MTTDLRTVETKAAEALAAAEDLDEALELLPPGWNALRKAARALLAAAESAAELAGNALERGEAS